MPESSSLAGRRILVTGGTRGIGLAIAAALLRDGARVAIVGRKADALTAALDGLAFARERVVGIAGNVGTPDDRERLIAEAVGRLEWLDGLVNNAAANPVYGPVENTSPEAFAKIMAVNLEAPFALAQLALPYLRQAKRADIINVSSIGGLRPESGLGIYSVSKAALNSLTQVLAKEWGPYGIHVNAICPGLIKTDFSRALWDDPRAAGHLVKHTPLGRIGEPGDIGGLVAALFGGAGAYVTGHVLTADGGYTV